MFKNKKIRILTVILSIVIILATAVRLILPAITMNQYVCGKEEHTHTAECYKETKTCICSPERLKIHVHTKDCYDSDHKLCCQYADYVIHTHDKNCYNEDGELICPLPEIKEHTHTDSCYELVSDIPTHVHTDACYEWVNGNLICGQEESVGHTHTDACYTTETICVCPLEESVGHTHTDSCYDEEGNLICPFEESEGHHHSDSCYETVRKLTCGLEESPGHTHTDACYEKVRGNLICTQDEFGDSEVFSDSFKDKKLICDKPEVIEHVHDDTCRDENGNLICNKIEVRKHQHDSSCFEVQNELICGMEEHTHTDACRSSNEETDETQGIEESKDTYVDNNQGTITEENPGTEEEDKDVDDSEDSDANEDGNQDVNDNQSVDEDKDEDEKQDAEEGTDDVVPEDPAPDLIFPNPPSIESVDISGGPVVSYYAGGINREAVGSDDAVESEGTDDEFTDSVDMISNNVRRKGIALYADGVTDLKEYVDSHNGSIYFTLVDKDNKPLPKDEDGNFLVTEGVQYKLAMSLNLKDGIHPGSYVYKLPDGLGVTTGAGNFEVDGVNFGNWSLSADGILTLNFTEVVNNYTDVVISAIMGVSFTSEYKEIEFDGNVKVVIRKKEDDPDAQTKVTKYKYTGSNASKDENKLNWAITIDGGAASHLLGNVLTDTIQPSSGIGMTHKFTKEDMENGILVQCAKYDSDGNLVQIHQQTFKDGDPHLVWDETSFHLTFPESEEGWKCDWHWNETFYPGDDWTYWIVYTSTKDLPENFHGAVNYMNKAAIDGAEGWGHINEVIGIEKAEIKKTGKYVANESGGVCDWNLIITLPAGGNTSVRRYDFWDQMRLWTNVEGVRAPRPENDIAKNGEVTARYVDDNGTEVVVPVREISQVEDGDLFSYYITWEAGEGSPGDNINHREIVLLSQCYCDESNCAAWNGTNCRSGYWGNRDYCDCWTFERPVEFTFHYQTKVADLLELYPDGGGCVDNRGSIYATQKNPDGSWSNQVQGNSNVAVISLPGIFKKELMYDYDGFSAGYGITINEGKLQLAEGSYIEVHDQMSDTLVYINGSMVIETEDIDGNTGYLTVGKDYTVRYDKDEHSLHVLIPKPEPVKYTITYDASLLVPSDITGGVPYSNSAKITLFAKDITSGNEEKIFSDINVSMKRFRVPVYKRDGLTGASLEGATFGIYNETGGLVDSKVTGADGYCDFETNVEQGVLFREHTPYYIQEITAPDGGYVKDSKKYWIYFCNEPTKCAKCREVEDFHFDIKRITTGDRSEAIAVDNYSGAILPSTGGTGVMIYRLLGVLLLSGSSIALYRRRKHS